MEEYLKEDSKRKGLFSTMLQRLGIVEKFTRDHNALPHDRLAVTKAWTIFHDQSLATVGAAITSNLDAAQFLAMYSFQNPSANGNTWQNGFYLRAGTYTLRMICVLNNNAGKLDLYIDNVLIASGLDFYAAGITHNNTKSVTNVVIAVDGYHVIKGITNGQNGASIGFFIPITKLWFEPAAF